MQPDDEICLCFHVTKRKVQNFLRVEKPKRVGQISECFGAGTGCGWCRPFLRRLFEEAARQGMTVAAEEPTARQYAALRRRYLNDRQNPQDSAHPNEPCDPGDDRENGL